MARSKKSLFYDKIHRGSVKTIMAFSGILGICLCVRIYNFMHYTVPALKDARDVAETEFLAEGKAPQEEFSAA